MKVHGLPLPINSKMLGDDITPAGKALMVKQNASAQLTELGVSNYSKSLLNAANATAALTTLGVTDYAKSFLAVPERASGRRNLGIHETADALLGATSVDIQRSALGLGSLATLNNVPTYTGSAELHTNFPVGTIICADITVGNAAIKPNQTPSNILRVASVEGFQTITNGAGALAGTWRFRGKAGEAGSGATAKTYGLFQRVA